MGCYETIKINMDTALDLNPNEPGQSKCIGYRDSCHGGYFIVNPDGKIQAETYEELPLSQNFWGPLEVFYDLKEKEGEESSWQEIVLECVMGRVVKIETKKEYLTRTRYKHRVLNPDGSYRNITAKEIKHRKRFHALRRQMIYEYEKAEYEWAFDGDPFPGMGQNSGLLPLNYRPPLY